MKICSAEEEVKEIVRSSEEEEVKRGNEEGYVKEIASRDEEEEVGDGKKAVVGVPVVVDLTRTKQEAGPESP